MPSIPVSMRPLLKMRIELRSPEVSASRPSSPATTSPVLEKVIGLPGPKVTASRGT